MLEIVEIMPKILSKLSYQNHIIVFLRKRGDYIRSTEFNRLRFKSVIGIGLLPSEINVIIKSSQTEA